MKPVSLAEIKDAAQIRNGQRLETLHRGKKFLLEIDPAGLRYTPESSDKPRIQEWKYIERVLDRFNTLGSFSPEEYKDLTMNAAYLLVLIKAVRP